MVKLKIFGEISKNINTGKRLKVEIKKGNNEDDIDN